jgi:hypothetical protein
MVKPRGPYPDSFILGFSIILRDGNEWASRINLLALFFLQAHA